MAAMTYGRKNMSEEEKKKQAAAAMQDPEIQSILTDPVIQQVLKDFAENQNAAQKAMSDPVVRHKISKLMAAGIIETA
jgi:stress-induced-phosphoprotein 1